MSASPTARARMLAAVLPTGTDTWLALFDGDPTDGGTELAVGGYARVAHSAWVTAAGVGTSTRSNVGAITFGVVDTPAAVSHLAFYDAAVGGNLLGSSVLRDVLDQPVALALVSGDNVKIGDGLARFVVTEV